VNDIAAPDRLTHEEIIHQVPLFVGLGAVEAEDLYRSAERIHAMPGERIIEEGAPGDSLYIILSGELEVTKRDGDRDISLATRKAGEFIGEMSLLEQAPRTASVRAVKESDLLSIGPDTFRRVLESNPTTATSVLRTVAGRLRSTEASLVQSEKLAALGSLAAGLAHELNNPAAAIQRSTEHLSAAFEGWRKKTVELNGIDLSADERSQLMDLEASITDCVRTRIGEAAARKVENALLDRLENLGVTESWELAPALATYGWTVERLEPVVATFAEAHLDPVLQWLGFALNAQQLMEDIRRASRAISDIVRSVKSDAYLDQAPVQYVDLAMSIDDTLMILNHKIKQGVTVTRNFEPDLPRLEAYAGELNQVWTNIIDNAVQAMDGKGRLEVGARRLGDDVEVRIADSGPGIPPDIALRIFEPFFTTKAQGVGTGLGLHIAHNIIVNRHRGRIDFTTNPGRTEFRIVLPLKLAQETK
jgi:signal transduction histidine kinase